MSSRQNNDLVERLGQGWQAALEQLGFCHRGRICLPFNAEPDAAITVPRGTPQHLQDLMVRAEANRKSFAPFDRGLERIDRRKHYQVVVETHGRMNPVHEANQ